MPSHEPRPDGPGATPDANGGALDAARAKRAFLAHMRHELRTPVGAIIGYSEMLLEDAPGNYPTLAADLEKIRASGQQLLALVSDILDPAKVEAQALPDVEEFAAMLRHSLRTPINTVIGFSEMLIEDLPQERKGALLPDLERIRAAAERLLTLTNEIISLWQVQTGQADARAVAPEMPAIVQETLATLRDLSRARAPAVPPGAILVVDDNETNRDLFSRRLAQEGHAVTVAENGRRALDFVREGAFDLVLLDVMMPEMNGFEVLGRLKADERLRGIPVIVLSALDEQEGAVSCIEMGADDYLTKPLNPVLLRARIGACLEKKRLRDREAQIFDELQRNYRRLQELEALRDSLTHMIVHDLRTPLAALISGLQMVEFMGELSSEQAEFLKLSTLGGETLLSMINDLLDVSKMESGALQLDYAAVAPAAVVERALGQVAHLAREKKIALSTDLAPDLPAAPADEEKLVRILVNLLGNAIKFTPSRGRVTVSGGLADGQEGLLFSVSDTGEGIPKEAHERIFDKFGQVEMRKAGRKMSTGLGLTFCKMAVEAHGG
ncbi:MAG: response regulator, partial [Armatimonadetes bacterium]|nr:response regulator [Armatimonadota bacterium]